MEKYMLNKVLSVDTTYRAEDDKYYVIERVGTNSTSEVKIYIAENVSARIIDLIAPRERTNDNLLGPIHLGRQYLVVPPKKTIRFTGASGSQLRILGNQIELAPGENVLPEHMSRYTAQSRHLLTYLQFSYSHGTDTPWAANYEAVIGYEGVANKPFVGPVGERFTLDRFFGVEVKNVSGGLQPGQFGLRIYVDEKPYDIFDPTMGPLGLEAVGLPLPPKATVNYEGASFAAKPLVIQPGVDLKFSLINISGASISPTTGASIDVLILVTAEREILTR